MLLLGLLVPELVFRLTAAFRTGMATPLDKSTDAPVQAGNVEYARVFLTLKLPLCAVLLVLALFLAFSSFKLEEFMGKGAGANDTHVATKGVQRKKPGQRQKKKMRKAAVALHHEQYCQDTQNSKGAAESAAVQDGEATNAVDKDDECGWEEDQEELQVPDVEAAALFNESGDHGACGCLESSCRACKHRSYSSNLLLKHREISLKIAKGPPGLTYRLSVPVHRPLQTLPAAQALQQNILYKCD